MNNDCECECKCAFAAMISIVLGIIISILSFIGIITQFWILAWLGISIASFAILLMTIIGLAGGPGTDCCVCEHGICLTIGALGSVILAIAIIAVVEAVSILTLAVLTGIGGFFVFLTLFSLLKLILCFVKSLCRRFD